jgi:membrane-associated phospholipid phosphatase
MASPVGDTRLPETGWRVKSLIWFHLAAALLLASWLLPVTDDLWDMLDTALFRFLNGSLSLGYGWQSFWALANNRLIDFLSGGLAALIFIWWLWGQPREVQNRMCAALCALAIVLMVVPFTTHLLNRHVFHYHRLSPTLVYDDALRLTTLVPWAETKDASSRSFPGDHAFILISVALYFWLLAPRKIFMATAIVTVIFLLPRLVGGAHWLTDNIMGGAVPALVVMGWFLATPLCHHMTRFFLPPVRLVIKLIPKPLRIPDHNGSRKA